MSLAWAYHLKASILGVLGLSLHCPAVWFWAHYLTSLSLYFLICRVVLKCLLHQ